MYKNGNINDIKDILKIRLHTMWDVKQNNLENGEDTICPIGQNEQDTTMHISHCGVELENRKHHGKY